MPFDATVYKVLIASPSDVSDAREAIPRALHDWNGIHAEDTKSLFHPIKWETHVRPAMGDRPQSIINKQIVDDCDVLIGTFWTRVGTSTGKADSGTIEEIERTIEARKPVMLYFSEAPVRLDSVDQEQYARLKTFKEWCQQRGVYNTYESIPELAAKLTNHLTSLVRELRPEAAEALANVSDALPITASSLDRLARAVNEVTLQRELEWTSERDSDPTNLDEAKGILGRLGGQAVDLRVALDEYVDQDTLTELEEIRRRCRIIQNHQLYLDGGGSWIAFWGEGDSIIAAMKGVRDKVRQVQKEVQFRNQMQEAFHPAVVEGRFDEVKQVISEARENGDEREDFDIAVEHLGRIGFHPRRR